MIEAGSPRCERIFRLTVDGSLRMPVACHHADIREAVEAFAPDDEAVRTARAERVLTAGTFDSGLTDVSERHDDYLAEDPRGW